MRQRRRERRFVAASRGIRGVHARVLAFTILTLAPHAAADEPPCRTHGDIPLPSVGDPVADRTELGVFPLIGGDSDIGLGIGALSALTRFEKNRVPYRWRLESAAIISFKPEAVPYQDYFLVLTLPQLVERLVRVEIRPSFTRETTQRYSGLGNASPYPAEGARPLLYGRTHPTLAVRARLALGHELFLATGVSYTQNWLDVPDGSKLAYDMQNGSPAVRDLLGRASPHGVLFFQWALLYDDRDEETSTKRGHYHQVQLRLSPDGFESMPYRYGQVNVTARFFFTPIDARLTLAARVVADLQFGSPPFYELARFEDTFAFGGGNGVRGVPGQRYYGKIKLFTNLEARSELLHFNALSRSFTFGAVAFFDAGRLWADWTRNPELDGTRLGLKLGFGLGARLQQGQSFVVRGDVAWSPDARPLGAYFSAGQLF